MGAEVVIVVPLEGDTFGGRLLSGFGIVCRLPLPEAGSLQAVGKRIAIVARAVNPWLRSVTKAKLRELDNALRSHETSDPGCFRSQSQVHIDRNIGVLEQQRVRYRRTPTLV